MRKAVRDISKSLDSAEWSSSQIDIYGIKLVINGTDRNGTEQKI